MPVVRFSRLSFRCTATIVILATAWIQAVLAAPQDSSSGTLTTVPSEIAARHLLNRADPVYSPTARNAGGVGPVKFAITVTETGTVTDVQFVSGHLMVVPAAEQAVLTWQYAPFIVNGNPARIRLIVDVPFSLDDAKGNDCRAASAVHQYSIAEPACKEAITISAEKHKDRKVERALLYRAYGLVLEGERKYLDAVPQFTEELAIAKKVADGGVLLGFAERDAAGAYQLIGDTQQALTHYQQAEHHMRDAWKHSKTPQVKAVSAQSLKAVVEKHAALLEQMGRNDEAAALRREASEI